MCVGMAQGGDEWGGGWIPPGGSPRVGSGSLLFLLVSLMAYEESQEKIEGLCAGKYCDGEFDIS